MGRNVDIYYKKMNPSAEASAWQPPYIRVFAGSQYEMLFVV